MIAQEQGRAPLRGGDHAPWAGAGAGGVEGSRGARSDTRAGLQSRCSPAGVWTGAWTALDCSQLSQPSQVLSPAGVWTGVWTALDCSPGVRTRIHRTDRRRGGASRRLRASQDSGLRWTAVQAIQGVWTAGSRLQASRPLQTATTWTAECHFTPTGHGGRAFSCESSGTGSPVRGLTPEG